MHVLLSNDDGVEAEGLRHLREGLRAARPDWRLSVVAPTTEQSATSHALTLTEPLRVREHAEGVHSVSGTPTDCVLLAMNAILVDDPPDVIVSGINHGPNMGEDVHYSGTVAAAFEGRVFGLPAIALSLADRTAPFDWRAADHFVENTLPQWLERDWAKGALLNVNIPALHPDAVKGIRGCRLGSRRYVDVVTRNEDPRGRAYYWIAGHQRTIEEQPDTDLVLSREGWTTVTPLEVDQTDVDALATFLARDPIR